MTRSMWSIMAVVMAVGTTWAPGVVRAQEVDTGVELDNHRITAGIELFGLFMNGRQAELAYERERLRLGVALASLETNLWHGQDAFSVRDDYVEVSASYYLLAPNDASKSGLHVGLNATYFYDTRVLQIATGDEEHTSMVRVGARVGYMWFPFERYDFFVEPTFNLGYAVNAEDVAFADGGVFEANPLHVTGMIINIGGAFDLR